MSGIDIIGRVVRGILLFGHSLRSSLETFGLTGTELKSRQTVLNWLRWFGTLHPATILTRAGIKGSGYFQEDEGFEKESGLRTCTVAMVDSENLLVWHLDYVDHVDAETLADSFEKFVERIDFKIVGITKDSVFPSACRKQRTSIFLNLSCAVFARIHYIFLSRPLQGAFFDTPIHQQHLPFGIISVLHNATLQICLCTPSIYPFP